MQQCINDESMSYKGTEKSPLGLGYSPGIERIGKMMKGKDDKVYIATDKTWKELNINRYLTKIPDDCYVKAFIPITNKIMTESGLESKFGGSKPFFLKDEEWPLHDGIPMTFIAQWIDPRKSDNVLIRFFLPTHTSIELYEYFISMIELNEENVKNQIIIQKPIFDIKDTNSYDEKMNNFGPFEITGWEQTRELKSLEYILKRLDIPECTVTCDAYSDHKDSPSYGIKVGGTPTFCQYARNIDEKNNYLQISESDIIPISLGDGGIGHIIGHHCDFQLKNNPNLDFEWDCC